MRAQQTLHFVRSRRDAGVAPEDHSPLKIVGVYADLPSHTLAMGVFRDVARNCSGVCKLSPAWWSFESLQSASARETAARAAADADMIWCSGNACERLPEAVRAWADSWSSCETESEGALVALLRCPSDYQVEQSPLRAHLGRLAQAAGRELFVERFECECRSLVESPPLPSLMNGWFPTQNRSDTKQIRWWGIND